MRRVDPGRLVPKAIGDFVSTLPLGPQWGVILFGSGATLAKGLNDTPSGNFEATLAEALHYRTRLSNLSAGVERALYEFRENGRGNAERIMLIVYDGHRVGTSTAATEDNTRWLLNGLAEEAKRNGVRIVTVVLGNEPDFRIAQTMALDTGGSYFRALTAAGLPGLLPRMLASATRSLASEAKPDRQALAPATVVPSRYSYWPWLLSATVVLIAIAVATLLPSYRFRSEPAGALTEQAEPLNLPSQSMPQLSQLREQGGAALKTIAEVSQLLRSLEEQLKTLQTISTESIITGDRAAESAEEMYSSLINDCISTVEFLEIMSRQQSLSGDAAMAVGRALKRVARILEHAQVVEIPVQCGMPFDSATQEYGTSVDRGEPYGAVTKIERKGYMMTIPSRGSVVLRPARVEVSCPPATQQGPVSSI
jgi:molecular chaperone GrpE (heat shock protein)